MKTTILQQLHDNSGHLGVKKTTEGVKQRLYTGQDMNLTSRNGYRNANSVSNAIFHNRNLKPLWEQSRLLTRLKISWDIMGPLPTSSKGKKYILVVTDIFSKWVEAFALRSTDAETLATVLVDEVCADMEFHHSFTVTKDLILQAKSYLLFVLVLESSAHRPMHTTCKEMGKWSVSTEPWKQC